MKNSFLYVFSRAVCLPALIALVMGCASGPPDIPEDLSAAKLIQKGQEASDRNRYNLALYYYEAVIERFSPDEEEDVYAARYEIAFIHYKQKKYDLAREEFSALLSLYAGPEGESLPPQYKRLADMVLEKMADKAI